MMSTIEESVKLDVSAGQVRRCRQQFEIFDSQGSRLICERERLVGITPRSTPVGLATLFESIEHAHDPLA
ncbi:MAG: hypothetical protein WCE38_09945 [Burkholderiales bacterium]